MGGGPAGMAAAIRLRQQLTAASRDASVVVIDKAPRPGHHCVSGAALETDALDELVPTWRDDRRFMEHVVPVERDEMYFLAGRAAIRVPELVVPARMHHRGDVVVSLSRLVAFLAHRAEQLGVELHSGFSARSLIVEDGAVQGVTLAEVGLDKGGGRKRNHRPAEAVRARVTILADGTRGVLSTELRERFGRGRNPQVYSLGIKAVIQFAGDNPFGANRVVHTLGYPNRASVFGGGFLYSMGEKTVAAGLIMGLDWKYGDLTPQREFETWRAHPFVEKLLHGGVAIATGAKTIPEGGWFSLGRLSAPGALVIGDGAGFVNMEKIKGIHYAMRSGMAAADTVVKALAESDGSTGGADPIDGAALAGYRGRLEAQGVLADLRHARNYRQSFRPGIYLGTPLSLIQSRLPGRLPLEGDHQGTKAGARLNRPDPGRMDGATFVSLTGSLHREDEPAHMAILDPARCLECEERFAASCTHFCPGQVYRWNGSEIVLSPSNCLHCMTCAVKCPYVNIHWQPPEGGEGPRFTQM
ncbi:MAG: electron transfer flavoprotein-ubiquinone oxidoreductase [Chloroflexi bacterium]|nr:electron transfer flavoprotein-ubiquinone oxidoreductase [Chloroflexota bacterium]